MTSIFSRLTQVQEETATPWQTKRLQTMPHALHRLATVTAIIEYNFCLPDQWRAWPVLGSVTFQHQQHSRWVVKAFIDDGNRLANRNRLHLSNDPIVVGVDLTDREPFVRCAIREHLRLNFRNYIDPEANGNKIRIMPDNEHWFDYLFLPDGSCELPFDESRMSAWMTEFEKEVEFENDSNF